MRTGVPTRLFPIDVLSSCMFWFAPLPYRSGAIRRLYATTKADVKLAGLAKGCAMADAIGMATAELVVRLARAR